MNTNTNKDFIIKDIQSIVGTSKSNIQKITDDLIHIISELIYQEKKVNIKNFGSFSVKLKNKRLGRNPKTKENYEIHPRNTIRFSASIKLSMSPLSTESGFVFSVLFLKSFTS